jgi:hypothetical protein
MRGIFLPLFILFKKNFVIFLINLPSGDKNLCSDLSVFNLRLWVYEKIFTVKRKLLVLMSAQVAVREKTEY